MYQGEPLRLSRYQLAAFLACQRRFQLRYITHTPWPTPPTDAMLAGAFEQGEQFHRAVEQYLLGLETPPGSEADPVLRRWWEAFERHAPSLPTGRRYPEMSLAVAVGRHFLFGRMDLLILGEGRAYIYDWKTERRPRPAEVLREDLQTRLYLALLTEGVTALGAPPLPPEQISLTYWFAHAPERSVTLDYDTARHTLFWAELQATVERIDRRLLTPQAVWPLTPDWQECTHCHYRALCGRHVPPAAPDEAALDEWLEEAASTPVLEPDDP